MNRAKTPAPCYAKPLLLSGIGIAALCGTTLLIALRVHAVRDTFAAYAGCRTCLDHAVLMSDLASASTLLLASAVGWFTRSRALKACAAIVIIGLLLLYTADLAVFLIFNYRLKVADVFRYGGDTGAAWTVVVPFLQERRGALLLLGFALAALGWSLWTTLAPQRARVAWVQVTLGLAALAIGSSASTPPFIGTEAYLNVISVNRSSGVDTPYSSAFKEQLAAEPELARQCTGPRPVSKLKSVILLVVESLSAHHSRLLGGPDDDTPQLDVLAAQNTYFEHFHANGFTTDGGLIALLAGRVPLPAVGRYRSTHAYQGYEASWDADFLQRLQQAGYTTQFLTTGNLGFLEKGSWLKGLGFQHIEGSEHPFYAGRPRGSFDDASDRALYDRYLQWWDREKTTEQVFSVLLTVSTHPPFHIPGTDIQGEDAAFRWADEQIAYLVEQLRARHYFEHGVLMITGDHRSMTVMKPDESSRFGIGAVSRIPAIVIGPSGLPAGSISGQWQQTDLQAGMLDLAGLRSCTDLLHGRLFGPDATPASLVIHAQGVQRDRLLAWSTGNAAPFQIQLDGDATHWIDGEPSAPLGRQGLIEVNRARAALAPSPPDFIEFLVHRRLSQ